MSLESEEILQLEYLLQIPIKLEEQLKDIYNTMSSDEWELVCYVYESKKTGCDYKNCSHASPVNGINHVYIVRERQSGKLLKVGINCYDKLLHGERQLSDFEKRKLNRKKERIRKLIQKVSDTIVETKEKLRIEMNDLEFKYAKLKNNELAKKFEIAKEILNGEVGMRELKRIVKIFQNIYDKYEVEYSKYVKIQNKNTIINSIDNLWSNSFTLESSNNDVKNIVDRKYDSVPKLINKTQVNTVLSENSTTYRFLTAKGIVETIDKKTEEIIKTEINRDICDPNDLLE